MKEQEEFKTNSELEAEARERARAEIEGQKSTASEPPPGQPKVVQHNKPKSKRTLIVAIASLLILAGMAAGGDYLMNMAKGGNPDQEDGAKAPATNSMDAVKTRTGMGKDSNPFEGEEHADTSSQQTEQKTQAPRNEPPMSFSKVSALTAGSSATSGTSSSSKTYTSTKTDTAGTDSDQFSDTALAQCEKVLVRAPDGRLYCPGSSTASNEGEQEKNDGVARLTAVKRLGLDPNLYIPVDTNIPCSLMERFVSDVAGRVSCLITEDVYSANHFVRLIPAGSVAKLLYKTGTLKNGMGRMFIAATEIRTPEPDALVIPLLDSQAVGQLGEKGVAGWVDEHWWKRIGNTLLLGTVQDFAAAVADSAPGKDRNTDYTENTRTATAEMAKTMLDNSINIPPTMYKNQGDIIALSTGADIDFSGIYKLHAR
ncbi:TrbI/VirB10 family protein [Salmonella enterica]|nr:TrbI/VirB10 family protein [Salmonella enterica]EBJ4887863.1 hypothetical protein [Salmonella enterica]ECE2072655.1 TrbI/VirB10 family protein [Salmonella enterica]ECL4837448.1 TrbI/VirB10 family protein [Salmonella enterica]ECO9354637.1 TrbI/VirB10 family protein [Salmonella enterica]